ncbi:MAG: hypothetical protein HUU46_23925 [Candidatus Hydrogenedentes bacterium]|nr:hypothetical protein [Candidatus Hydrogenedentota bacterium]
MSKPPSWRASTVLVVALSLSIGWSVRGNFGHEYGAMLMGVMAALAESTLSWLLR